MDYKLELDTKEWGLVPVKYRGIEKKRETYEDCDSKGNLLVKKIEGERTTTYTTENGEVVPKEQVFKLINGKAYDKLAKTKKVEKYSIVDRTEAVDLIKERYYQILPASKNAEGMKEWLSVNDKAMKFRFSNGNGYKAYITYIIEYSGEMVMLCGNGYLAEQIQKGAVAEVKAENKKAVETIDIEALV